MSWITIDEEGREHVTMVHQVECRSQKFDLKKKQFICIRDGEDCTENCPLYYNLQKYTDEDDNPTPINIESMPRIMMEQKERTREENNDTIELEDDYVLLDYLKKEIWN